MNVSTEIISLSRIVGEEKAVEYVAKAGFDAWDFSLFNMVNYNWGTNTISKDYNHPLAGNKAVEFAKKLKKIADDNGIYCNQSHAPFPTKCKEIRNLYKKSIELTAIAGGRICIVHPDNDLSAEENGEMYLELLPFAKEHNVKIATENMWNWDTVKDNASFAACSNETDFKKHIDFVNDDYFVACVDVGHAEMKGLNTSAVKMIKHLGSKVQALHIHDNEKWHDSHQKPMTMDINFDEILKALKEINYSGELTLEADAYLATHGYDKEPNNVFKGIKELYDSANELRRKYESL